MTASGRKAISQPHQKIHALMEHGQNARLFSLWREIENIV